MTTREFIRKTYNTTNDKWGKHGYDRVCSSVVTDKDGIVYSYGSHYPLAFNINGLDFINVAGYSATTGKHIAWAKDALGYEYIGVKLNREDSRVISSSFASQDKKLAVIKGALTRELKEVKSVMRTKKRKKTFVYADLKHDRARLNASLNEVDRV